MNEYAIIWEQMTRKERAKIAKRATLAKVYPLDILKMDAEKHQSGADLVVARVMSAPTPKRQSEDW